MAESLVKTLRSVRGLTGGRLSKKDAKRIAAALAPAPARSGTPRARNSDPSTSAAGARDVEPRAGSQMALLLAAFREHGPLTDAEAAGLACLEHIGYWKRCSDLRNRGLIEFVFEDGEPVTREGPNGSQMQVSRAVLTQQ